MNPIISTPCCSITPKDWLPKIAVALIPVAGVIIGIFLESEVARERYSLSKNSLQEQAEILKHENHYKISFIVNASLVIANLITGITLGVLSVVGGIIPGLLWGGFMGVSIVALRRDISYIEDLEKGINPWAPRD